MSNTLLVPWYTIQVNNTKKSASSFLWPLFVSTALSVGLFIVRLYDTGTSRYWFLLWNLALAWLPLMFACLLYMNLKKERWFSWKPIVLAVLWLLFLPNSFYLITDFIHLGSTGEVGVLFDAVLFMSFAWNGLLLGFASLYIVHRELNKRFSKKRVLYILAAIFILSSFAIYLGRFLAWNSWDILLNPAGILFDVSDRVVRPSLFPNTFMVTALFTSALSTMYYTVYKLIAAVKTLQK